MGKKTKTIQSNLFINYSIIILTVLVVFVAFFYIWVSNLLNTQAVEKIDNLSYSISQQLDVEVQKMDSVSVNVLYSNIVMDRFKKYISDINNVVDIDNSPEISSVDSINNSKDLVDMLIAIIGPNRPVQQMYIYDFNGRMFGTGSDNRQLKNSVMEKYWYNEVIKLDGKKYISLPQKDEELSKFAQQYKNAYFISLCRVYFDNFNVPQGIVEVKQYYNIIFNSISVITHNNISQEQIYVFNKTGEVIYPLDANVYYYKYCNTNSPQKSYLTVINPVTKEKELLKYKYSELTGWITAVVVSENKLLSPVFDFTRIVIWVAVLILLLALLFSFFIAKKITIPIAKLHKAIRTFDLESISSSFPQKLNSGLNEMEELNNAFQKMNVKMKKSLDDLILSQQHEMQARMLALQSQMNPHFLYNTLANISVMAEEAMDDQIIEMCSNVSDMLRYISSDKSPLVKLSAEIEYTEKYLACMKLRYGNKLSYSIEINDEMKDIKIPKLVIQPLVENALKYGTCQEPPWTIRITGYLTNTYWQINIQDNGSGFDPQKLKFINEKIEEINRNGLMPSLELDGMGLLNIYIRLKLSYKNQMTFQISDNISGGAMITIGGSV